VIGAFLNLSAVVDYLANSPNSVLVVCAGWKGKVNMEDTLFAGAVVQKLKDTVKIDDDSALMAMYIYNIAKGDKVGFLKPASHIQRLKKLGIQEDIVYCLTEDKYDVVPRLREQVLCLG
jgi:2-phosphosulfolactate phosphatase